MKTLIFEQWQGGHYFNYLDCLVPRLAEISSEVVVAVTKRAAESDAFRRQLGHLRSLSNVRIDEEVALPSGSNRVMFRRRLAQNVLDAIDRSRPDYVFLPSADEQLLALPLLAGGGVARRLRDMPIEAVIHYKAYTSDHGLRDRLLSSIQRNLLRVGIFSQLNFVNCLQYEDAVAGRMTLAKMARAAGDPVPQRARIERRAARAALGLSTEGRWIGMIGELDERKAVPATLAAFRAAGLKTADRLLLAGRLLPAYAQLVSDRYSDLILDGRLVVFDRYLTESELVNAFAALDVHCSVYERFNGLSSLMLKSIAAGVPVLVANQGWGRAIVRRFGLGRAVEHRNSRMFSVVLGETLEASSAYIETDAIRRLLRFHRVDNFVEGVVERAAAQAGCAIRAPVLSWSWVLDALPSELRNLR